LVSSGTTSGLKGKKKSECEIRVKGVGQGVGGERGCALLVSEIRNPKTENIKEQVHNEKKQNTRKMGQTRTVDKKGKIGLPRAGVGPVKRNLTCV